LPEAPASPVLGAAAAARSLPSLFGEPGPGEGQGKDRGAGGGEGGDVPF